MIALPSIIFALLWPNWNKDSSYFNATLSIRFLAGGLIPSVILVTLNSLLYRKLLQMKLQLKSTEVCSQKTIENMKKSMFRARLSFFIALTYVVGQILFWIPRLVSFLKLKVFMALYDLYYRLQPGDPKEVAKLLKVWLNKLHFWSVPSIAPFIITFTSSPSGWIKKTRMPKMS